MWQVVPWLLAYWKSLQWLMILCKYRLQSKKMLMFAFVSRISWTSSILEQGRWSMLAKRIWKHCMVSEMFYQLLLWIIFIYWPKYIRHLPNKPSAYFYILISVKKSLIFFFKLNAPCTETPFTLLHILPLLLTMESRFFFHVNHKLINAEYLNMFVRYRL